MEWLFGLALLPVLLCVAMCAGGTVLAFMGVKRSRRPSCHTADDASEHHTADDASEHHAPFGT